MISNSYNTKSASEIAVSMFGSTGTGGRITDGDHVTDVEVEGHLTTWNLTAANAVWVKSHRCASERLQAVQSGRLRLPSLDGRGYHRWAGLWLRPAVLSPAVCSPAPLFAKLFVCCCACWWFFCRWEGR